MLYIGTGEGVRLEYILRDDRVEKDTCKEVFERAAEKAAVLIYSPFRKRNPTDIPFTPGGLDPGIVGRLSPAEREFAGEYFVPSEKVNDLYNFLLAKRMTPIDIIKSLSLKKIDRREAQLLADEWKREGYARRFDDKLTERTFRYMARGIAEAERERKEGRREEIEEEPNVYARKEHGLLWGEPTPQEIAASRRRMKQGVPVPARSSISQPLGQHLFLNSGERGLKHVVWRRR